MSDSTVEVAFRADLSELESGTTDAVALIRNAADQMADAFAPKGVGRATDDARQIADEKLQIDEQAALKSIAIETDHNDFLYAMGEESLDKWKQQADEEANAKYVSELAFLDKKTAADRGDAAAEARDLEQRALLYQEHVLALQKIDEQYAERKRALEREELQDALSADNAKLSDGLAKLDAEYRAHQISMGERYALEQQLTEQIYGEELKRLDALIATLSAGTKTYEDAIRQREKIEQEFERRSEANTNQLETEEAAKWTALGNSIKANFNSAIDGMIFGGKTFGQGMIEIAQGVIKSFLQMGETIAEHWIETQLTSLVATKTTQGASALGQISDAAGVAGANAFAATSAIPIVGPELAPAAAAAAVSETLSFSSLLSLAEGAWELKSDTLAQLHKGEMVVPENFASGLRANGAAAAGDVHMNYSPTINAREPASLEQMLVTESSAMLSWLNRQMRNGALRA